MFTKFVETLLHSRFYVVLLAVVLSLLGGFAALRIPIDVFPDLNRPYVNILIEAHGYAPEEVERLITFPIESSINGAPGVVNVRSNSGVGRSVVTVEFEWGMDIYLCRQIVQERLQLAGEETPEGISIVLAPVSSVTGEIMRLALTSDGSVSDLELRSIADWDVRLRLLTINGVAQVINIGGSVKEYQIAVDPVLMAKYNVSFNEVEEVLQNVNTNTPGGFVHEDGKELLVRNIGRVEDISELETFTVKVGEHGSVRLGDIAKVVEGRKIARGTAGVNGKDAVIMTVLKQPGANTLDLTERVREELGRIRKALPEGVVLNDEIYQQARFIQRAVSNVVEALRDGALLVVLVIAVFLMDARSSTIILTAIPLSFVTSALAFRLFGMTVNTMTLGGLAIAVGELVDSAIVGTENIYRRLRENNARPELQRGHPFEVVSKAMKEVLPGIVLGTVIVLLVVTPLFALPGVVGRLFSPIGLAYAISILSSTVIALTLTPVLSSLLFRGTLRNPDKETFLVKWLKRAVEPIVLASARHPRWVLAAATVVVLIAIGAATRVGRDLLPAFNEGSYSVLSVSPPGTNLEQSTAFGLAVERAMRTVPEIAASVTGRRTGRAEGDEHAHGVNFSEIEVEFGAEEDSEGRSREEVLRDLRQAVSSVPGVVTEVEQPIQHRISVVISGARTQVAIRIFGPDLKELRRLGQEVHTVVRSVPGVVDDYLESQVLVPQLRIVPDPLELSRYGLRQTDVVEAMELALQGKVLSKVLEGERYFDLVLRGTDSLRENPDTIPDVLLSTPTGGKVPLKAVANISKFMGPNEINHENSRRRMYVYCNVAGRDLASTVAEIRERVDGAVRFPEGYTWAIGGQYEQMVDSGRRMTALSLLALLATLALLIGQFRSLPLSLIVLTNIPQALIGSVLALLVTGTTLSVGAMVGFVALCGIASRNGILMISHWVTLIRDEGEEFNARMILRGCKERLTPVLMTALTTNLGLIPLVLSRGAPGKEILYPVAIVIFGGLFSSTLLNFTVTPAATVLFGKRAILRLAGRETERENGRW